MLSTIDKEQARCKTVHTVFDFGPTLSSSFTVYANTVLQANTEFLSLITTPIYIKFIFNTTA